MIEIKWFWMEAGAIALNSMVGQLVMGFENESNVKFKTFEIRKMTNNSPEYNDNSTIRTY
jgi:hypothetical protein